MGYDFSKDDLRVTFCAIKKYLSTYFTSYGNVSKTTLYVYADLMIAQKHVFVFNNYDRSRTFHSINYN